VSSDALGAILSWMQERQGAAFVVATANDVEGLPPELLRKGRFDELFFVDAPNRAEREAVLLAAIRASNAKSFDVINAAVIATRTDGFTGAEIAALVPDAMFAAFNDGGRAVTTQDLKTAAATVVPLTTTAKEKIDRLRKWAAERARNASAPAAEAEATATRKSARTLDIA
jgi:SpoVK/Ycf46/Vps4 family AAA+-type ATPase